MKRRSQQEMDDYILEYKLSSGCIRCSERVPVALDFHHKDPQTKLFSISAKSRHGIDSMKREIQKCVVLCSNCHRKLHAGIWRIEDMYERI